MKKLFTGDGIMGNKQRVSAQKRRENAKLCNQQKARQAESQRDKIKNMNVEKMKNINTNDIKHTKTTAKKLGLKSTIIADKKIILTSFINEQSSKTANIEKVAGFKGDTIDTISYTPRMFRSEINPGEIVISKGDDLSEFANPANFPIGRDYVKIRSALEKQYFGKEFPEDNLHVQIAYNVADIKKILSVYINNIIYMFYNLARSEEYDIFYNSQSENSGRDCDVIGSLYYQASYRNQDANRFEKDGKKKAIDSLLDDTRAYYTYFDGLFSVPKREDDGKIKESEKEKAKDQNFDVLRLLSVGRQLTFHSDKSNNEAYLFDLSKLTRAAQDENRRQDIQSLLNILNSTCRSNLEGVNGDFVKHAKNNLYVLNQLYPSLKANDLIGEYYNFIVKKENRNIGIRLITVRELIIEHNYTNLKDSKYDTYRNKIYTVLNFILFREIQENSIAIKNFREKLRSTEKAEQPALYQAFANKIYPMVQAKFAKAIDLFEEQYKTKFKSEFKGGISIENMQQQNILLQTENIDYFSKYVLFLTKFLDGKEINELLCALINKFDNIADLLDISKQIGTPVVFCADYESLNDAAKIAENIRLIKNIAHLRPAIQEAQSSKDNADAAGTPATLLIDAYNMLNTDIQLVYGEAAYEELRKDLFERKIGTKYNKKGKKVDVYDHKFRNFLINNVIKSKWFFYIAKYVKPADCAKMMSNKKMIEFALRDLPETQIKRYYYTITGNEALGDAESLKGVIIEQLHAFSIKNTLLSIKNMGEGEYKIQQIGSSKEKLKAIVNLYLTVAYLLTKSLVKVNIRFSIAFGCLERDLVLQKKSEKKFDAIINEILLEDDKIRKECDKERAQAKTLPRELAQERFAQIKRRESGCYFKSYHVYDYLSKNSNEFKQNHIDFAVTSYRNNVEHLNVVHCMTKYFSEVKDVKSYYGVYCYIMQRMLCDELIIKNQDKPDVRQTFEEYNRLLKDHGTYSKNLMWLLNFPFAYNLARYKNLSNEDLFNAKNNDQKSK